MRGSLTLPGLGQVPLRAGASGATHNKKQPRPPSKSNGPRPNRSTPIITDIKHRGKPTTPFYTNPIYAGTVPQPVFNFVARAATTSQRRTSLSFNPETYIHRMVSSTIIRIVVVERRLFWGSRTH